MNASSRDTTDRLTVTQGLVLDDRCVIGFQEKNGRVGALHAVGQLRAALKVRADHADDASRSAPRCPSRVSLCTAPPAEPRDEDGVEGELRWDAGARVLYARAADAWYQLPLISTETTVRTD